MQCSRAVRRPSPPLVAAVLAVLSLVAACGSEPRGLAPVVALPADGLPHELHIGREDPATPEGALGRVMAARITDGARHVVVLDFVPPFVKVFDRTGNLRAAFLQKGEGPGEARRPGALAVSGDSLVLVADPGRGVLVFDLDGRLRAFAATPGLVALAAAAPCPGEWLVYGPRMSPGGAEGRRVPWLHRVRITGAGEAVVTSGLPGPVDGVVPMGLAHGMVAGRGGALVRHAQGDSTRVLRWECGGTLRRVHTGAPMVRPQPAPDGKRRQRTTLVPGTRAPAGVAEVAAGVVLGEMVYLGPNRSRTELFLLSGGRERRVAVVDDFVLQDSHPGLGVLVSTSDPVPQLFLLTSETLTEIFPPE